LLLLSLTGCVPFFLGRPELVPLCPAIAEISFTKKKDGQLVNYFAETEAKRLGVKIRPLSSYTASVEGNPWSVAKLVEEYKFLMCAFNPKLDINDRATYLSCMSHAESWIDTVRSERPEKLMLKETLFRENCTPRVL
jgi:hypothetical protein